MTNENNLKAWYLALADREKLLFLAFLAHDLTLHGRYCGHDVTGQHQSRAFMGLNELHHQISGHIAGIELGRDRYPDAVLWEILDEKATAYGILAHLRRSLEAARSGLLNTTRHRST